MKTNNKFVFFSPLNVILHSTDIPLERRVYLQTWDQGEFSLVLSGGDGIEECRGGHWGHQALPLMGAKGNSGERPKVAGVRLFCVCSFLEIAGKLRGNWILEIRVPGPFAVVCILLMSIGFPRSLLVLCS